MQLFKTGNVSLADVEEALARVLQQIKDLTIYRENNQLILGGTFHGKTIEGTIQDTKAGPDLHLRVTPHISIALLLSVFVAPGIIALAFLLGVRRLPGGEWIIDPTLAFPHFFTLSGLVNLGLLYLFFIILSTFFIVAWISFNQRRTFPDVVRYAVGVSQLQDQERLGIECTFHQSQQHELVAGILLFFAGIVGIGIYVIAFITNPTEYTPFSFISWVPVISALLVFAGTIIAIRTSKPKFIITQKGIQTRKEKLEWKNIILQEEKLTVAKEDARHIYRMKVKKVLVLRSTRNKSLREKIETKELQEGALFIELIKHMVSANIIRKS